VHGSVLDSITHKHGQRFNCAHRTRLYRAWELVFDRLGMDYGFPCGDRGAGSPGDGKPLQKDAEVLILPPPNVSHS
jgi:hypothetical protein